MLYYPRKSVVVPTFGTGTEISENSGILPRKLVQCSRCSEIPRTFQYYNITSICLLGQPITMQDLSLVHFTRLGLDIQSGVSNRKSETESLPYRPNGATVRSLRLGQGSRFSRKEQTFDVIKLQACNWCTGIRRKQHNTLEKSKESARYVGCKQEPHTYNFIFWFYSKFY